MERNDWGMNTTTEDFPPVANALFALQNAEKDVEEKKKLVVAALNDEVRTTGIFTGHDLFCSTTHVLFIPKTPISTMRTHTGEPFQISYLSVVRSADDSYMMSAVSDSGRTITDLNCFQLTGFVKVIKMSLALIHEQKRGKTIPMKEFVEFMRSNKLRILDKDMNVLTSSEHDYVHEYGVDYFEVLDGPNLTQYSLQDVDRIVLDGDEAKFYDGTQLKHTLFYAFNPTF